MSTPVALVVCGGDASSRSHMSSFCTPCPPPAHPRLASQAHPCVSGTEFSELWRELCPAVRPISGFGGSAVATVGRRRNLRTSQSVGLIHPSRRAALRARSWEKKDSRCSEDELEPMGCPEGNKTPCGKGDRKMDGRKATRGDVPSSRHLILGHRLRDPDRCQLSR